MSAEKKLPYMPWYPIDFWADDRVEDLDPIAELAYRRLLDWQWMRRGRGLPKELSSPDYEPRFKFRSCLKQCSEQCLKQCLKQCLSWCLVWDEIEKFFELRPNGEGSEGWYNPRLHEEWEKSQARYRKALVRATKGARSRWGMPQAMLEALPQALPEAVLEAMPSHHPSRKTSRDSKRQEDVRVPVDAERSDASPPEESMSGDVVTSAEEADRALVWTRLASHPWGFRSREKILAIIERGTTAADLDAWERESQRPNRGQPWAMSKIQEFARPTDIPRLTKKPPTGDGW